jgi:hypothetical protein
VAVQYKCEKCFENGLEIRKLVSKIETARQSVKSMEEVFKSYEYTMYPLDDLKFDIEELIKELSLDKKMSEYNITLESGIKEVLKLREENEGLKELIEKINGYLKSLPGEKELYKEGFIKEFVNGCTFGYDCVKEDIWEILDNDYTLNLIERTTDNNGKRTD